MLGSPALCPEVKNFEIECGAISREEYSDLSGGKTPLRDYTRCA